MFRRISISCLLLFIALKAFAQTGSADAQLYELYSSINKDAKPSKWVQRHLKYPVFAIDNAIEGKVILTYTLDKYGKLDSVSIQKSVHPLVDNEAIRMVRKMHNETLSKPISEPIIVPVNFFFESNSRNILSLNMDKKRFQGERRKMYDSFPEYTGNLDSALYLDKQARVSTKKGLRRFIKLWVTITKDGKLVNVRNFEGAKKDKLNTIALERLLAMNKSGASSWKPAIKNGQPVDCDLILRVT